MSIAPAPAEISRPTRTAESTPAPLRGRLSGSREQARKPGAAQSPATGINTSSASPTLPDEIAGDVAQQFWQLAAAYRPTTALGVNAVLELAVCLWKTRRLFEQYAAHLKQVSLQVHNARRKRAQRQAVYWFARLGSEPGRALAQLEQLKPGLKLIISTLENMVCELQLNDGTWSSSQFATAVNLSGFTIVDVWNDVRMRRLWGAWFGSFPNKDLFYEQIFRFQAPTSEYEARADEAIRTAPPPAEARERLNAWALAMIEDFEIKLEQLSQTELELAPLAGSASDWPNAQNSTQHLLHLRYTHQVDRKTLELYSLLATVPAARTDEAWDLAPSHLPRQWRDLLMAKRQEHVANAPAKAAPGLHVPSAEMQSPHTRTLKPVEEAAFDFMMEAIDKTTSKPVANRQMEPGRAALQEQPAISYQSAIEIMKESLQGFQNDTKITAADIHEGSSKTTPIPAAQKKRLRSDMATPVQPPSQRTLKSQDTSRGLGSRRA